MFINTILMKKTLLFFAALMMASFMYAQQCSDLFISEYIEGSGNNKAIEIYNPTENTIDLSAYQLVRYSNGGFVPAAVALSGTVDSKSTFVVVLDKRDPSGTGYEQPIDSALMEKADLFVCPVYEVNSMMYFNGNDAVTLEKIATGEIVDIFAQIGPPMTGDDNGWGNINDTTITYNSGGNPTQYTISYYNVGPLFWLAWTKDHTLIRKTEVEMGITENPDPYFIVDQQWDSIPEDTFDSLGFHRCNCASSGIGDNYQSVTINVYPNPVINNIFTIESEQSLTSVQIFDLQGRIIEKTVFTSSVFSTDITVKDEFKGVLFVSIKLKSGITKTHKLIIK